MDFIEVVQPITKQINEDPTNNNQPQDRISIWSCYNILNKMLSFRKKKKVQRNGKHDSYQLWFIDNNKCT